MPEEQMICPETGTCPDAEDMCFDDDGIKHSLSHMKNTHCHSIEAEGCPACIPVEKREEKVE